MRRMLLFLLFAGVGSYGLLALAGGLAGPATRRARPEVEPSRTLEADLEGGAEIALTAAGELPMRTRGGRNVGVTAGTETLPWQDAATGEVREIRGWFRWRFRCASFEGLPAASGGSQGVRCRDVVLEVFRLPRTLAEAEARIRGETDPVLEQRFQADEAVAFGSLASRLRRDADDAKASASTLAKSTVIHLAGDVVLIDREQGLQVNGQQLTVRPGEPGREVAEGRGPFEVLHEAYTLTGTGLRMDRVEPGWTRLAVQSNPRLDIRSDVKDERGRPMFGFGDGEFRPTTVFSEHQAIIVRETGRRETRLRIQFPDGVRAEQSGGRSLEAGALQLLAAKPAGRRADQPPQRAKWRLQELSGRGGVQIDYADRTADGRRYLANIAARQLVHTMALSGPGRTELIGQPRIVIRGGLPLSALAQPGDHLYVSARDRAWIEPVASAQTDAHVDPERLRRISLRGAARIERRNTTTSTEEDMLEASSIDLVLLERDPRPDDAAPQRPGPSNALGNDVVAMELVAEGDVHLDGSRIRGSTPKLVAEALHTERPHIFAEGEGTRFEVPLVRRDQRLLGAEPEAPEANPRADEPASESEPGEWTLKHVLAQGDVRAQTHLGGATLGVRATIQAREASYEAVSGLAKLSGDAGAPVRIASRIAPSQEHEILAPALSLDRGKGQITARQGVRGRLWLADDGKGGGRLAGLDAGRDVQAALSMGVSTNTRLDLHLVRRGQAWAPAFDTEQRFEIGGPAVVEMRSARMVVDRLQAERIAVTMAYTRTVAPDAATPASPFARMRLDESRTGSRASRSESRQRTAEGQTKRSPMDFAAGHAVVQFDEAGEVSWLDANGGVDLHGNGSRVGGERLRYEASTQRIDVLAGGGATPRPAAAWLGSTAARTEIEAARLALVWREGQAQEAQAMAPEGAPAHLRLYREDEERPGRLERFEVRYWGTVTILPERLEAGRVIIVRTARDGPQKPWSPPAAIYAHRLSATGRDLLSSKAVEIERIVASGPDTYFLAGPPDEQVQIWGERFEVHVPTERVTLLGTADRDVVFEDSKGLETSHERIEISLSDRLPVFLRGPTIIWRPDAPEQAPVPRPQDTR